MAENLLLGERELLAEVVASLSTDAPKLVYADWLEEHGDDRADFLRAFVRAAEKMEPSEFPAVRQLPEEWLELVGYRLLERAARANLPELRDRLLRLARPALRIKKNQSADGQIPLGASKIGGLPDLPPSVSWPLGGDCRAIYNDDTGGTDRLAGFLAQINFTDVSSTQAARDLPSAGILSFFCFQDIENDHPDAIGVKAMYFADSTRLGRTSPPQELTEGNGEMSSFRLSFEETLDLPEAFDGPWSTEINPTREGNYDSVFDHFRSLNFYNVLGYGRATSGCDPTPSKSSRHLIVLDNDAGCRLHIQISQDDLSVGNFDQITLNWVDFD